MRTFLPLLVALVLAPLAHGAENLALGRPYTLSPAPNYEYCTESGDAAQLTDGAYTMGYFWTQPTTVGWSKVSPVVITIDLGADVPIDGVSFSTAARIEAGAHWPRAIFLRVSTDGRQWYDAGELLGLATAQGFVLNAEVGPHGHMARNYRADGLAAHGRYIAFVVAPSGDYCFCDEIEVYRGPDSLLSQAATGKALASPEEGFEKALSDSQMSQVILADAAAIGRDLAQSSLPPERKKAFQDEMLAVLQGPVDAPPLAYYETFPLNETHRKVLELANIATGIGTVFNWFADLTQVVPEAFPQEGSVLELVITPCGHLRPLSDERILEMVIADIRKLLPGARDAEVLKSRLVRDRQGIFAQRPHMDRYRPTQRTPLDNLYLCGDFTMAGHSAGMEGAVVSGKLATSAILLDKMQVVEDYVEHPHFSHGLIPFIKYGQPALLALLALRMLKNKLSKA